MKCSEQVWLFLRVMAEKLDLRRKTSTHPFTRGWLLVVLGNAQPYNDQPECMDIDEMIDIVGYRHIHGMMEGCIV